MATKRHHVKVVHKIVRLSQIRYPNSFLAQWHKKIGMSALHLFCYDNLFRAFKAPIKPQRQKLNKAYLILSPREARKSQMFASFVKITKSKMCTDKLQECGVKPGKKKPARFSD